MDQYMCRDTYFFVSCLKLLSETNRSHINILEARPFARGMINYSASFMKECGIN
jgi:hypothetical protein